MNSVNSALGLYALAVSVFCAILYSDSPRPQPAPAPNCPSMPAPTTSVTKLPASPSSGGAQDQNAVVAAQKNSASLPENQQMNSMQFAKTAEEALQQNILRYVSVSPEQKEKLLALHKTYAEIESSFLSPEEQEAKMKALPTEEDILGPELNEKLRQAQVDEEDGWRTESAERTLAYLEHAMGTKMTGDQKTKAVNALRAYDEYDPNTRADAETAYLDDKLGLSKQQYEQVRTVIGRSMGESSALADVIDNGSAAPQSDEPGAPIVPNEDSEESDKKLAEQLAPFLNDQQKAALQTLFQNRHRRANS